MRASFIASEIGIGLRRNLTMTVAMIITTAVSLGFLGMAILFNQQVSVMKDFWYDKVEVSVFLCGADSGEGRRAAARPARSPRTSATRSAPTSTSMPQVERVYYESKQQAYTRFKEQFKNSAIVDNVTADQMPESFRVKLVNPEQFDIVASAFVGRAGVDQVQDQKALLEKFFKVLNWVQWFATGLALLMILVSVILIVNTIRVAAFSRRRETGIMKLVGASNFSIQLPFLLEGAISGFLGALLATGVVRASSRPCWSTRSWRPTSRSPASSPGATSGSASMAVFVIGVALAAIASSLALIKYLRV